MILRQNQRIDIDGSPMVVQSVLGSGGQGEVYLVSFGGNDYALKVYKSEETANFKYNLKNNIERKSPSGDFLWPLKYLEFSDGHFGYLMDLRPKEYKSFVSYLNGKEEFKNTATLLRWCIELCIGFKTLHERGFSYQDLNDGSFFLKPDTGDLLICDNDNVTADKKNLGILGKMRYMAPEIVRGETLPDVHSDRFSLAVILFLALCKGNPYEGARLKDYDFIDENAEMELFGTKPLFVYHKTDKSNRPIRGYHSTLIRRWRVVPTYIKEAFHRTFIDGLSDRENERTTELEWIKLLVKYRDELVTCGCGKQYAFGFDGEVNACPYCNAQRPLRLALSVNKNRIVLEPKKELFATHLDKYSPEYNKVIGRVVSSKSNPARWGVYIEHEQPIAIYDSAGAEKQIAKGGVIPIVKNLTINFDENVKGEIN